MASFAALLFCFPSALSIASAASFESLSWSAEGKASIKARVEDSLGGCSPINSAAVARTMPSAATAQVTGVRRGDPLAEWEEFKRHDSFPACNSRGADSVTGAAFPDGAGVERAAGPLLGRTHHPAQSRYCKVGVAVNIG